MSGILHATAPEARRVLAGTAEGPVIFTREALSFWGGIDPASGNVIDVHHPLHGACITGSVLVMPSSRGSCTGSGVLLDLALSGRAPAALVFCEAEDVLTLGALVASEMFGRTLPVLRVTPEVFSALADADRARIDEDALTAGDVAVAVTSPPAARLALTDQDRAFLAGEHGLAAGQAMRIICRMAEQQGAETLVDVTRAHIDGCIYASPANLTFAEKLADMGASVRIPTTMNAISVDRENWRRQGVAKDFGDAAARLADAYVRMGCRATFTCAPYLLDSAPGFGEAIGWAESNAVIFANTVLGARTPKHPDFLDLCIALTGRAPLAGVYRDADRKARRILDVDVSDGIDDAFWPLLGYVAGRASPDRIPLLRGLSRLRPGRDDLKALCAAFGTTSAAPMLHVEEITPESGAAAMADADVVTITMADMADAWNLLNDGPEEIELVAIGSPHASLDECRALAEALHGLVRKADVAVIVTAGRDVIAQARRDGVLASLEASSVQVLPDLCWCSISEPLFPPSTRTVITNSGKCAHYGPGLFGRDVRFGSLADCVIAATTGSVPRRPPVWLAPPGSATTA